MIRKATVVAGKLLIRALPVEHHLETGAACLVEDAPLRKDAGAAVRLVLVPSNALGQRKGIFPPRIAPMGNTFAVLDHSPDERTLVDALHIVACTDAMDTRAVVRRLELAGHQTHDRGAVETTRKACSYRDVRAQMDTHRVG